MPKADQQRLFTLRLCQQQPGKRPAAIRMDDLEGYVTTVTPGEQAGVGGLGLKGVGPRMCAGRQKSRSWRGAELD